MNDNTEHGSGQDLGPGQPVLRNQLLQLIPSGVGVYDVTGDTIRKEYLNDGYFQMIGADREQRHQYDGIRTADAVLNEDMPGLLAEMKAAILQKRVMEYSFRVVDGAGIFRWIAVRANHVPLGGGTERFYASYYDIDELVRTRNRLQASEMLYRDMLTNTDTVHFIYYPDRHRCEVLVMPRQLADLPQQMDRFPDSFYELTKMSESDQQAYQRMIDAIDAGQDEAECTVRISYDGKYIWYHVHMKAIKGPDGILQWVSGSGIDIDRFKQVEEAFYSEKANLEHLSGAILAASSFNVTADSKLDVNVKQGLNYPEIQDDEVFQQVVAVDPAIARQSPETLKVLLAAASQIPDPRQRQEFIAVASHAGMLRHYNAGQRDITLEYRRMTGKGLIWVATRVVLMPDPQTGDVIAFFYTSDINDRRIEQDVARRLLQHSFSWAAYIDLQTDQVHDVALDRSQVEVGQLSSGFDSFSSSSISQRVHPDDQQRCQSQLTAAALKAALEQAPSFTTFFRLRDRAGDYRNIMFSAFYLDAERRYMVVSQTDVTAQQQAEQQNKEKLEQAARKAETANAAKTDFLSRMSHDIRTPLNGIIGMTALARQETDAGVIQGYLSKIDESGHFLLGLVNDILDMTKVESGKMELHPEPYSYAEFERYLQAVVKPLCDEHHVSLTIDNPITRYVVSVDKTRLAQIFFNLLSNAAKFTPAGGHVVFRIGNHKVEADAIEADFVVSDDGIGMSREFQRRMFEPFEQASTSSNAYRTGSGLGLAIVKSLVTLMGGTVSCQSAPGAGTTFTVHLRLPLAAADGAAGGRPGAKVSLQGLRVLVVEDNAINGEIEVRLLQKQGVVCELVTNGRQAVDRVASKSAGYYDAILMDVRMPQMDGLQATRAIRALDRPDVARIPIVALTANAFDDDIEACRQAGMDSHLAKPVDPQQLYQRLGQVVGRLREHAPQGRQGGSDG